MLWVSLLFFLFFYPFRYSQSAKSTPEEGAEIILLDANKNPVIRDRLDVLNDEAIFFEHSESASFVAIKEEVGLVSGLLFEEIPAKIELNIINNGLDYFQETETKVHLQALAMQTDSLFPEIIKSVSSPKLPVISELRIEFINKHNTRDTFQISYNIREEPIFLENLWDHVMFHLSIDSLGISGAPLLVNSSGIENVDINVREKIESVVQEKGLIGYYEAIASVVTLSR